MPVLFYFLFFFVSRYDSACLVSINRFILELQNSELLQFVNSVSFILGFWTPFVPQVFCGTHLRLLVPWATRLLSQWMLHWLRVSGSTAREQFPLQPTFIMQNDIVNSIFEQNYVFD